MAVNGVLTVYCDRLSVKVIINAVNILPTNKTVSAHCRAASTNLEDSLNSPAMACSFCLCTPVYNGSAYLAVCSACVACFCTCCSLIVYCYGCMYVSCASVCLECRIGECCLKLCVYAELFIGECAEYIGSISVNIGDLTHVYVYLKVIRPEAVCVPICFCCVTLYLNVGIVVDNTDGKRCKCCSSCLGIFACTCDRDSCCIILFVDSIRKYEALCENCMIKLKVVTVVEVDLSCYGLDSFDIGCIYIHPIYGTAVKSVESCIVRNYLYCGSINAAFNLYKSYYNGLIAHVIADLELNAVNSVCYCDIADGDSVICKSCIYLNTVNVCLNGRYVKACCICLLSIFINYSCYCDKVALCYSTAVLLKLDTHIGISKSYCAENGSFSVIYSIREVCCNVININCLETVDSTVCLPEVVCICVGEHELDETEVVCIGFTGSISDLILAIKTGNKNLTIRTYVNGEISPAGFVNSVIYLRLINNGDCILLIVFTVIIGIIPIKNTDPAMLVFIGYICPESDRLCVLNNNTVVKEQITLSISTA